ncbi:MAG: hypothetical protein ACMUIP_15350, partial [bacterium]
DPSDTYRIGNTLASFSWASGSIQYDASDDTTDTFRKLMKDYEHNSNSIITESYLHQVIDKETLVGRTNNTGDNPDVIINDRTIPSSSGQIAQDTGLYELYNNVVRIFIQNLINLAVSYSINSNPTNVPHQWIARTEQVHQTTTTARQPVSYSYGGRQTIHEFNITVSKHRAPSYQDIQTNPNYNVYLGYIGNIRDASEDEQNTILLMHGIVCNGTRKWPGLYEEDEYSSWAQAGFISQHPYAPYYWAGIDCIGLVLQSLRYAEDPPRYAQEQYLDGDQNISIPGISVAGVCLNADCTDDCSIHDDYTMGNTNVKRFFDSRNADLLHQWPGGWEYDNISPIHKGDLAAYIDSKNRLSHISIIYSEKQDRNDNSYQIIHASGDHTIRYGTAAPLFNRKVVINLINEDLEPTLTLRNPHLFGRLKLWKE